MAERIGDFSPRRIGRPALYPWTEWSDGSAWRITRGSDFEIPAKSMAVNIYSHARRTEMDVEIRIDGDAVEFRFGAGVQGCGMTDPKPGAALTAVLKAADARKGAFSNAKANQAAEKELIYQGDLTLDELVEVQPSLKREFYARNPHFLGS